MAIAIGVAATGSFLPDLTARQEWLFLAIGLLWVPWASVVLLATDSAGSRLRLLGGPVGDLLVLFAVQVLAPGLARAALPAYVAVVAFAAYTRGRGFASFLAVGALTLTFAAQELTPPAKLDVSAAALLGVVLVALVLLLDRTAHVQRLEVARSDRLAQVRCHPGPHRRRRPGNGRGQRGRAVQPSGGPPARSGRERAGRPPLLGCAGAASRRTGAGLLPELRTAGGRRLRGCCAGPGGVAGRRRRAAAATRPATR